MKDWREHSKQFAKGVTPPVTIESLQAAWQRDQEVMFKQAAEISKLKMTINDLRQKLKSQEPGTAEKKSTKACPRCGCSELSLLHGSDKKLCTGCGYEIDWPLEEGQKSIFRDNIVGSEKHKESTVAYARGIA